MTNKTASADSSSWKSIKNELTYKTDLEKEVIECTARIANQFVLRRKEMNLTQRDVSEMTGITQAQVARIENNNYTTHTLDTILKVALVLNLKIGFN